MKKARLIPEKSSGAEILTSFVHLFETIPRKKTAEEGQRETNAPVTSGILRKTFRRAESVLSKLVWFAGRKIGVRGINPKSA
jgi:hypothetical protein